jgi:asparagine synthase (glutamine-hydrolysing)
MCGIAGYLGDIGIDQRPEDQAIRAAIRYRGRDGEGVWSCHSRQARLFHSRLSIIDVEKGAQPMVDRSNRYVIVFNGEIYNYLELRKSYSTAGASFRTFSDTEIILEGFKLKGEAVCQDLNGMFAFAIWDISERKLFLACDRLGKKPLYWTRLDGRFYFTSSLDAFSAISGWTGELSKLNLDAYAALGNYLPGETAFRQAMSLSAGCYAWVNTEDFTPKVSRYWQLDFSRKSQLSLDSALEQFEELIVNAIDIRLRADVPVALTFSGGVDSGIIAVVAKKFLGRQLSCWTIDYDTEDDRSEETEIARRVAAKLGLDWHFKHFDYHSELLPTLRSALEFVDQPCGHIAISYSRQLYAAIRPKAKVVLSGNGADELFLGYNGNEQLAAMDAAKSRASWLARWWRTSMPGGVARHQQQCSKLLADYQTDYIRANLGHYPEDGDTERRIQAIHADIMASGVACHADLYTYMGLRFYAAESNFRIPDIIGLSEQVEVRSPFLDYRIVEFAAALPVEYKVGDTTEPRQNKLLLKTYYQKHVPADIAWAPKKGMGGNLRYDLSLASDHALHDVYEALLDRIKQAGVPETKYRDALEDYVSDWRVWKKSNKHSKNYFCPPSASFVSAGLMLGLWIERSAL